MAVNRAIIVSPKQYEAAFDADGADAIVRISLNYLDFAAAALTGNYDIPNWPGGIIVQDVFGILRQNFTGGAVGSATLSFGATATPTDLAGAVSVFSGAPAALWTANANKGSRISSPATAFVNASTPWASGTIRFQLITTVANTNALTQGKVDIFLMLRAASVRT